jgi:hypothetical protein
VEAELLLELECVSDGVIWLESSSKKFVRVEG